MDSRREKKKRAKKYGLKNGLNNKVKLAFTHSVTFSSCNTAVVQRSDIQTGYVAMMAISLCSRMYKGNNELQYDKIWM